jgi:hypothetical protein
MCLKATAELIRRTITATMSLICGKEKDNSLRASDGVLYDSNSEPIFVTEE